MAKKKKDTVEFRFYEVPQGEAALVLWGESWIRTYGHEDFRLHFHNLLEIGICRYGAGRLHLEKEVCRYQDGVVTVIPENFPHITISDGEEKNFWEYLFIDVNSIVKELFPDKPLYQSEAVKQLCRSGHLLQHEEAWSIARLIDAVIEETKAHKPFYQKMVKNYIQALILELIRKEEELPAEEGIAVKGNNMSQIAAALDYINRNCEQPIRIKELADSCGMSETHFRRIFQEYINMTPMDYVNLNRIQKACNMMKKGNDSMDTVAAKCGFLTTSTFNRNFKKFVGTSPYQWKIDPENYEHKLLDFRISALKGW